MTLKIQMESRDIDGMRMIQFAGEELTTLGFQMVSAIRELTVEVRRMNDAADRSEEAQSKVVQILDILNAKEGE